MIPSKAVRALEKKEKQKNKIIGFRFPKLIQFFMLGVMSVLWEAPKKGALSTRGKTPAQELNLEKADFVFDHQPDAFCSRRDHQWLSSDLTRDNFSAHNY